MLMMGHFYKYTIISVIKIPLTSCKLKCIPPLKFKSSLY